MSYGVPKKKMVSKSSPKRHSPTAFELLVEELDELDSDLDREEKKIEGLKESLYEAETKFNALSIKRKYLAQAVEECRELCEELTSNDDSNKSWEEEDEE
jgi:chromosome segregation ATPase